MLDETKRAEQDTGQEAGAASAGGTGTTSQTKTYSEDEKQKAISDALAAAGRDAKALEQREASLKEQVAAIEARQAEIAKQEEAIEAAEREAAKYDPDRLKDFQARQAEKQARRTVEAEKAQLAKERAELAKAKAEQEVEVEAARKITRELKLREICAKHEVPFTDMDKLGLSVEQTEAVAKAIAAARSGNGKDEKPADEAAKQGFIRDSGVTSGATQKSEEQRLKERYPSMK